MSSTFGLLNTAYSGLAAAKAALDATGQNISNASTPGYTRQRVDQQAVGATTATRVGALGAGAPSAGQGVEVTGMSRLTDAVATAQVQRTAASSGYWQSMSSAASTVETALNEPGSSGLTETLSGFWTAWQVMGNNAGSSQTAASSARALLGSAQGVASTIAAGYSSVATAWSAARSTAAGTAQQVNSALTQVATLNGEIAAGQASGANVNDLLDARDTAVSTLSNLAGATTRQNTDGSLDVVLGGRTVVSGTTARSLVLVGATDVSGTAAAPVHLELADAPGTAVAPEGGVLAGAITALGPANDAGVRAGLGSGGVYAEAAAAFNDMATTLAAQVNGLSETGATPSGITTGAANDFFGFRSGAPAALGLLVKPTDLSGIAAATTGASPSQGGNADAIAQLGTAAGSPDAAWASYVSQVGTVAKNATAQSTLAAQASTAATTAQTAASGVDLDEETANLVVFQHAYQAAARVLTTVDQMLDTLINNTGLVGRA